MKRIAIYSSMTLEPITFIDLDDHTIRYLGTHPRSTLAIVPPLPIASAPNGAEVSYLGIHLESKVFQIAGGRLMVLLAEEQSATFLSAAFPPGHWRDDPDQADSVARQFVWALQHMGNS